MWTSAESRPTLDAHVRFVCDSKNVDLRESLAVLALLAAIPGEPLCGPLANRTNATGSLIIEAVLAALPLVVAFYHVNDPFAAIGIYLTLIAALVWAGSLAWWWADARGRLRAKDH